MRRLITMLGLAAVAAMSTLAFLAAGSASAVEPEHSLIGLCTAPELILCAKANRITKEQLETGLLLALTTKSVLKGALEETCKHSYAKGLPLAMKYDEATGTSLLEGDITLLEFSECSPCTSVTTTASLAAPFTATLAMKELNGGWEQTGTGEVLIEGGFGCFGNKCKFEGVLSPNPIVEMVGEGETAEAVLNTNSTELKKTEGGAFCGEKGTWTAKYKLRWTLFNNKAHETVIGEDKIWPTLVNPGDDV